MIDELTAQLLQNYNVKQDHLRWDREELNPSTTEVQFFKDHSKFGISGSEKHDCDTNMTVDGQLNADERLVIHVVRLFFMEFMSPNPGTLANMLYQVAQNGVLVLKIGTNEIFRRPSFRCSPGGGLDLFAAFDNPTVANALGTVQLGPSDPRAIDPLKIPLVWDGGKTLSAKLIFSTAMSAIPSASTVKMQCEFTGILGSEKITPAT